MRLVPRFRWSTRDEPVGDDVIAVHVSRRTLHLLLSAWQRCDGARMLKRGDGTYDLELTDDVRGARSFDFEVLIGAVNGKGPPDWV